MTYPTGDARYLSAFGPKLAGVCPVQVCVLPTPTTDTRIAGLADVPEGRATTIQRQAGEMG